MTVKPDDVGENLRNLIWDHAVQLGVPGHPVNTPWRYSSDPEALTVLISLVPEPRLQREWPGWLSTFGDVLYPARLKRMVQRLRESNGSDLEHTQAGRLKRFVLITHKTSQRSFQPVLDLLSDVEAAEQPSSSDSARIKNQSRSSIVSRVPRLFWRHVVGLNGRAELLAALNWDCSGNSHKLAEDLDLAQNSVRRAIQRLEPTGLVQVESVDNSRVVRKGSLELGPKSHREDHFIDWTRWIQAVLPIQARIKAVEDQTLSQSLEERFTRTVQSLLEEHLLDAAFHQRHDVEPVRELIRRILPGVSPSMS